MKNIPLITSSLEWLKKFKLYSNKKSAINDKDEAFFTIFKNSSLFKDVPESAIRKLYEKSRHIILKKGEYLFRDGDVANEFYILIEGSVSIVKYDTPKNSEHTLAVLHIGESIGEMALTESAPRSASVIANFKSNCIAVPFDLILLMSKRKPHISNIFIAIAKKLGERLRHTNNVTIKALERQLEEYSLRVSMANFVLALTIYLVFFIFIQIQSSKLIDEGYLSTEMAIIFEIVSLFFIILLIKTSSLTFKNCGVTLLNWKKSVIESILFTTPLMLALALVKWILLKEHVIFLNLGGALFSPFVGFSQQPPDRQFTLWLTSLLLYCVISVPMQELIIRGALQTAIQKFQTSKHSTIISILLSNAIFSSFHMVFSLSIALFVFLPGLFFGWLYSRHHTLIGACLSHCMLGVWGFWILGVWLVK